MNEIQSKAYYALTGLLRETPFAEQSVIDRHHSYLKDIIDSGLICEKGEDAHRDFHELMWMVGYERLNGCPDSNTSAMCFITGEKMCEKKENCQVEKHLGKFKTERKRFNEWYAVTYENDDDLNERRREIRDGADSESREDLGKGLGELTDEDLYPIPED